MPGDVAVEQQVISGRPAAWCGGSNGHESSLFLSSDTVIEHVSLPARGQGGAS